MRHFLGTNRACEMVEKHVAFGMPRASLSIECAERGATRRSRDRATSTIGFGSATLATARLVAVAFSSTNQSARFLMAALLALSPVANQVYASQ